ncbi:hypothetical protein SAMN05444920_11162 [Nonomuraea solani]|uniref:Uncharacterized protein n=1 Tax=Nonomuraea solani TaxID=1144553 RepID=A0A1H6ELN0_9ACTN|nr:DUF5980 family protein [Nonomuraea solani]SEG97795.1 hypothetical protein SAMN05444920_11162 [Nonomuraea solani]
MKSTLQRAAGLLLGLALVLVGVLPTPAAATTWELRDVEQRMCVTSDFGHPNTYFVAPVFGSWTTTIRTGIQKMPPGSSSLGGSVIPPGSNYGSVIIGFVHISIAPAPVGVYIAEVWASDGVVTQTVPVRINVQVRC